MDVLKLCILLNLLTLKESFVLLLQYLQDLILVKYLSFLKCLVLVGKHLIVFVLFVIVVFGRAEQLARYRNKLSGPLLDRIDLHVEVPAVPYADLRAATGGISSAEMRARVLAARAVQEERFAGLAIRCNAELSGGPLERHCALDAAGHGLMEAVMHRLGLSARAYTRVLRLARTIADLAGVESIRQEHLAEAVALRVLDRGVAER